MKIFPTINISKLISNMHCSELNLDNFKDDFLNILMFFFAPSDSRFSAKYCPNHTSMESLFNQFSYDVYI